MTSLTKISVKNGNFEFSGEGKESWLEKQLDKLLKQITVREAPGLAKPLNGSNTNHKFNPKISLASFLAEKNAKTNQNRKFLATAAFLQLKGKDRLQTVDVTRALSNASQKRLGNPSDTLNQNVGRGHCEKEGKDFFVTDDGFSELGIDISN